MRAMAEHQGIPSEGVPDQML